MLTGQSTPYGMGLRLTGEIAELRRLGEAICQAATRHPEPAVGDILNSFGLTLRRSRKTPTKRKSKQKRTGQPLIQRQLTVPPSNCRVSWPRFLYCLNILRRSDLMPTGDPVQVPAIQQLSQIANMELSHWEKQSHFPLAFWTLISLQFYQGDQIHGLLYMAELAWGRRKGGVERMNYLGTVLDIVSPGAWLHHDNLAFVRNLPFQYPGNGMAVLREDSTYELATKRW